MHTVEEFLPLNKIKILKRQKYDLFGHSAVKACHYTKSSIRGGKFCYKFNFYGIRGNRCIQMTPSSNFCNQECTFCWRTLGWDKKDPNKIDSPKEIVEESFLAQRRILSGFGSIASLNEVSKKRYEESKQPKHVAISLTGEPTLYKKLPEMIEHYRSHGLSTFLVTNGTMPDVVAKCRPTQLYISLEVTNEKMYNEIDRPMDKNAWQNLNKTLELLPKHPSRTVIRITAIKGQNMESHKEFAPLIAKAKPMYIEIKAYSWVGFSRHRLKRENAPTFEEVGSFSEAIAKATGYSVKSSVKAGKVYLLARPDLSDKPSWIDYTKP